MASQGSTPLAQSETGTDGRTAAGTIEESNLPGDLAVHLDWSQK